MNTLQALAARYPVERADVRGVPVSTLRMPSTPSLCLLVSFQDGVAYESEADWGISHLLEHLLFRGTASYPTLYEISRRVEGAGGRISAFSTRDMTAFYLKAVAGQEELCVEMLSELLLKPALDEASFPSELAVIEQERRREEGNLPLVASQLSESLVLAPDPICRHPIGWLPLLKNLRAAALREHLRAAYHLGSLSVAWAGALRPDLSALTESFVSAFPAGPARQRTSFPVRPPGDGADIVVVPRGRGQAHLSLAWPFPVPDRRTQTAWRVLNTLLGAGYSSLLNWTLREKHALTYLCVTRLNFYGKKGVFRVNLSLGPSDIPEAIERIDSVIHGRIGAQVLQEALRRIATDRLMRLEDPLETAHGLLAPPSLSPAEALQDLADIQPADLERLCAEHLRPELRKTAVVSGAKEAARLFPQAAMLQEEE
ncbi:MAG: pitrilysin family protein [Elusimicrobiota bacterium]